jgi:hypothetical protein
MTINYTTFFYCKTLQNLPKLGFLFEDMPSGNPGWEQGFVLLDQGSIQTSLTTVADGRH